MDVGFNERLLVMVTTQALFRIHALRAHQLMPSLLHTPHVFLECHGGWVFTDGPQDGQIIHGLL